MATNNHSLNILYWNCNGITNKINELYTLAKKVNSDIILLGETKLNPTKLLKLRNYITYRSDNLPRPGYPAYGGTAILVHHKIVHRQIFLDTQLKSSSIEISVNQHTIRITSVYKSPNEPLILSDITKLTSGCDWFIVTGDLNAKHPLWNSRIVNSSGITLYDHVQQSDYSIMAPDTLTHFPSFRFHRLDVLDIALVRLPQQSVELSNTNDLSSDHNPILLQISDSPITSMPSP